MFYGVQGSIQGIVNDIVNITDANVHCIQARGQGTCKRDFQNY